jgi:8-oxo-dGTP pyrophosphatase MutT (NUDIX family)
MKLFVGAKALIVHDGKVLLLREAVYDEGTNTGKWDVPGGRIHDDEPLLDGLKREVLEESGLRSVSFGDVLGVYETFPEIKGEKCHIIRVFYAAYLDGEEDGVRLSSDHDAFEWVSIEDVSGKELVSNLEQLISKVLG